MPRSNAREILESSHATREEVCRAIMWLSTDLKYVVNSLASNPAQETQVDIKESYQLLEQLQAKLASLG